MSATWRSDIPPAKLQVSLLGWGLVLTRGLLLVLVIYGGLLLLLALRLIERPLFGLNRPLTPGITQTVCRCALRIMGLRFKMRGRPMQGKGAVVANHASWLDIFTLNAGQLIYFVSKSEVAGWPGIGWLARATGTVFITREGREAATQRDLFEARLQAGHRLLFFPEGTSTDGQRILPFKSTLFAAFFTPALRDTLSVQPVTVIYSPPPGSDPRLYAWWGDMSFGPHLLQTLSHWRQGSVEVIFHAPVRVTDFSDRKALAAHCEAQVRSGFPT